MNLTFPPWPMSRLPLLRLSDHNPHLTARPCRPPARPLRSAPSQRSPLTLRCARLSCSWEGGAWAVEGSWISEWDRDQRLGPDRAQKALTKRCWATWQAVLWYMEWFSGFSCCRVAVVGVSPCLHQASGPMGIGVPVSPDKCTWRARRCKSGHDADADDNCGADHQIAPCLPAIVRRVL